MRILVVSDTHRYLGNFHRALEQAGEIDMIIHAGDVEEDVAEIKTKLPYPVVGVAGNNDWGRTLQNENLIDISGTKIFVTHGHRYDVRYGEDLIFNKARKEGAKLAIFGHTHVPVLEERAGITILNPGSLTLPRQFNHIPSYAVVNIHETGEFDTIIRYVEK